MILRVSPELSEKFGLGAMPELSLCENPYADWSCDLFRVGRTQYVLIANTRSLYSCVMYARNVTRDDQFISRAVETIRDFMSDDGQQFIFAEFIATAAKTVSLGGPLDSSVTSAVKALAESAKYLVSHGAAPGEVGFELNEILLSDLGSEEIVQDGRPRENFIAMREG